jgi:hypothetical protein
MGFLLAIVATAVAFVALWIFLMMCWAEKVARDSSRQPPLRHGDWQG